MSFNTTKSKQSIKEEIRAAKERMLNSKIERESEIKRCKENRNRNKNKKFYNSRDLEFNFSEEEQGYKAVMQFENGWGISVIKDTPSPLGYDYTVTILDKSGNETEETDLNIIEERYGIYGRRETYGIYGSKESCIYERRESCLGAVTLDRLNEIMEDIQKLDENGKLPKEYSENAVSGVVVADKIAEKIRDGKVDRPIEPTVGEKLSKEIKQQYFEKRYLKR